MNGRLEFLLERSFVENAIRVFMRMQVGGHKVAYVTNLVFQELEQNGSAEIVDPSFRLTKDAAENLMNELWHCGIRPSAESGEGTLAATRNHLNDMRKIAFRFVLPNGGDDGLAR